MSKIYDVGVIGCGPAGISAAIECINKNLSVIVCEKGESHNMSIRKFYKEGKRVDKDYKGQVVELKGSIDFKDGNRESTLSFFDEILSPVEAIEAIVPQIEKGQQLIMDSVQTLEEIQAQAQDSLEKAQTVASSSSQQESTMQSISHDMQGIATLSQETHLSLEHANKTIDELKNISDSLKEYMSYFKI